MKVNLINFDDQKSYIIVAKLISTAGVTTHKNESNYYFTIDLTIF